MQRLPPDMPRSCIHGLWIFWSRRRCVPVKSLGETEAHTFFWTWARGLLELDLESQTRQTVLVAYGEYLTEGHVPRLIPYGTHLGEGENPMLYGTRDFSVEYGAAPGKKRYLNPFRRHDGLYYTDTGKSHISELGCALAVLTGVADAQDTQVICRMLAGAGTGFPVKRIPVDPGNLTRVSDRIPEGDDTAWVTPASFSMATFIYDALLQTDTAKYGTFVLRDIEERCGYMLDQGATAIWETMGGWRSFENAGSLCHGWSAMAVYYYHQLKEMLQ